MKEKRRMLVACEFSGLVRDAFARLGWDAWSCDLQASDRSGQHVQGDVRALLVQRWDLLIAFPPCTYLSSSGQHWTTRGLRNPELTDNALGFVRLLMNAPIKYIAIENPVGVISTQVRKPDQIIHPWQFGHPESKATCLWLKNLPRLVPTNILPLPPSGRWENQTLSYHQVHGEKYKSAQNKLRPSATRAMDRSRTYPGVADAMSGQWTVHVLREGRH